MRIDKYIQDGQDQKVVEKIYAKIIDMLTVGESIHYIALQKKPAVTILPDTITVSNKRLFLCEFTKLGLATNFEIFSWENIKDISFKEEIFGSKVTVIPFTGENLTIDYIPKIQARKLYQLIKEYLELHKSGRQNAPQDLPPVVKPLPVLDEKSEPEKIPFQGSPLEQQPPSEATFEITNLPQQDDQPILMQEAPPLSASTNTPTSAPEHLDYAPVEDDEITMKLKKLKNLFDRQLISQSEYEQKKAEVLSQL